MSIFPKIPDELVDRILKCKKALVCGHSSPDGDCANSVMAMGKLLKELKKDYILVNDGPYLDSNIGELKNIIHNELDEAWIDNNTLGIVVDCGSPDRVGKWENVFSGIQTVVIDHHASGQNFGITRYVVPESPSTTLLVYNLFKTIGVSLNKETATLLFRGFITDTGYFRFLNNNHAEVFSIVGDLVSYGISPNNEYAIMTGGQPFKVLSFLGELLNRSESFYDNKLIITHEEESDYKNYNCATPSNEFYQHALATEGSSVVVSLKISKKQENSIEVGFRSQHNSPVDVGKLAFSLGGGGHAHAAGATIPGSMDEVKKIIIDAIGKQL